MTATAQQVRTVERDGYGYPPQERGQRWMPAAESARCDVGGCGRWALLELVGAPALEPGEDPSPFCAQHADPDAYGDHEELPRHTCTWCGLALSVLLWLEQDGEDSTGPLCRDCAAELAGNGEEQP